MCVCVWWRVGCDRSSGEEREERQRERNGVDVECRGMSGDVSFLSLHISEEATFSQLSLLSHASKL